MGGGYHAHDSLHTRHVACTFKIALAGKRTALPLVNHSDGGTTETETKGPASNIRRRDYLHKLPVTSAKTTR